MNDKMNLRFAVCALLLVVVAVRAESTLQDGLLLYYSFDQDEGGRVTDQSGRGRDATVKGPRWTAEGACGGAYHFQQENEVIEASDAGLPMGDAPRTLAWWFKLDRLRPPFITTDMINYGTLAPARFFATCVDWRVGRDCLASSPYGWAIASNQRINQAGVWHHAALTYAGHGQYMYYMDGRRCPTSNESPQPINTQPGGRFLVGTYSPDIHGPEGCIDEVRLYDRVLDPAEVTALYEQGSDTARARAPGDYDADRRADWPVFNPPNGAWYIYSPGQTSTVACNVQWGWSSARPVVGDYDGDGRNDLAAFDSQGGYWYIRTVAGTVLAWANRWGWSTANPVPGDYNGDGTWDQAVFDTQGGYWYVKTLAGNLLAWANQWGWSTAKPVPGDYNGDGAWDQAVFDTQGGYWYIKTLAGPVLAWANQWGWSTVKPVPGDYDGDGVFDLAVFDTQSGNWYIKTLTGSVLTWKNQWGWSTAKPVSGDYDGDGRYDLAVVDTVNGRWYVKSLTGTVIAWGVNWGWAGATFPALGD